jgi:hypothetical protein
MELLRLARELMPYEKVTRGRGVSQMSGRLTLRQLPGRMKAEDGEMRRMRNAVLAVLFLGAPGLIAAQQSQAQQGQNQPPAKKNEEAKVTTNRLRIEVTGGDANTPIENASVYVKTVEQHLIKDKKFEVNVKTNQNGLAHVPDTPMGRVLIQVVADGWKTYGRWYDITDAQQVIKIHLEKPPKWY